MTRPKLNLGVECARCKAKLKIELVNESLIRVTPCQACTRPAKPQETFMARSGMSMLFGDKEKK